MARGSSNNKINTNASSEQHHDLSVIAESLDLSHKNVAQIAFVLENGSDDVKNLLLNECNIIYECRVCLSMFRSFGNFVAHKRLYCKGHECERMVLYDPSWFRPKIDEKAEILPEKIVESSKSSSHLIKPEKTFTNPTKYLNPKVAINSYQAIKSPNEVPNKKMKQNSVASNVNSLSDDQNNSETNGIAPASSYSNEASRNTISNNTTSTSNRNNEEKHQNGSIQSKSFTRQCKRTTKTFIRQQKLSKSTKPSSKGSTFNEKEVIKPQNELSSSIESHNVVLQEPKNTVTNEPVIIHRHFHHNYHLSEPIILPTSNSVIKRKICTKKSKRCPIPEKTEHNQKYYHNPLEVINID